MSYWSTRRVLVTGGAGFLGSCLVEKLRERGCSDVFVPRRRDYDLVQMGAVARVYDDARPNMVIHLAAQVGGIGANLANPGKFFYDNLMMGAQLMEVGRQRGLEKFVALGTICAYPKITPLPFKEENIWDGYPEETNAPYGLAKKMLLVQSLAYRQQYGFNSIVLFPVNLYGPRDNFDPQSSHVIPALVRKFVEAKTTGAPTVTVWGTGMPTREFLYVEDAAEGVLLAAERYDKSEAVNIGSSFEISIRDLVEKIQALVGYQGEVLWDKSKPDGQPRRKLDVQRALREFGFKSTISFEEGLRRTLDWYRAQSPVETKGARA